MCIKIPFPEPATRSGAFHYFAKCISIPGHGPGLTGPARVSISAVSCPTMARTDRGLANFYQHIVAPACCAWQKMLNQPRNPGKELCKPECPRDGCRKPRCEAYESDGHSSAAGKRQIQSIVPARQERLATSGYGRGWERVEWSLRIGTDALSPIRARVCVFSRGRRIVPRSEGRIWPERIFCCCCCC